jgi:hypothetical protein
MDVPVLGAESMNQRQRVISQIHHQPTDRIPMSKLEFEGDVAERLDAHYGSKKWRALVVEHDHILRISGVDRDGTRVQKARSGYIDAFVPVARRYEGPTS